MKYDHPAYLDWERRAIEPASGPTHLTVLSTGRCNLSCFMCGHSLVEGLPVAITPEAIGPWLQKAQRVFLAGGEPLWLSEKANPAAARIFHALLNEHPHLKINAYTNGVMLDETLARVVIERFESLHFSVDTVDPAIYESVRGKPLLPKVLENMEMLWRLKRGKGLGAADHPHINMNSIVMRRTMHGLPAVARELARLEGHKHCLVKLNNVLGFEYRAELVKERGQEEAARLTDDFRQTMAADTIPSTPADGNGLDGIREELRAIYTRHDIETEDQANLLSAAPVKEAPHGVDSVCYAPWVTADIHENGDVYCCCSNNQRLGNVLHSGFDTIWNGPAAKDLRASFIRGEMKGCLRGGCPAVFDYFRVEDGSYSAALLDYLEASFEQHEQVKNILLLRTAPDYQCHLAARTLLKRFPGSRLTVVTNEAGADEVRRWGVGAEVLVYPGAMFEADRFGGWWRPMGRHHSMATIVYNNNERRGYEQGERILASLDAAFRIGIRPDGRLLKF